MKFQGKTLRKLALVASFASLALAGEIKAEDKVAADTAPAAQNDSTKPVLSGFTETEGGEMVEVCYPYAEFDPDTGNKETIENCVEEFAPKRLGI